MTTISRFAMLCAADADLSPAIAERRLRGMTWAEIADECGLADGRVAMLIVRHDLRDKHRGQLEVLLSSLRAYTRLHDDDDTKGP